MRQRTIADAVPCCSQYTALKPVKQRNKTSKRMEKGECKQRRSSAHHQSALIPTRLSLGSPCSDLLSESDSDVSSSSASSSSSWEERRKTGPFRTRHGVEQRKRYDPVDEM